MTAAIFLRAVNLGGNRLRTKPLAEQLGLTNLGAAGTFIGEGTARRLKSMVEAALPFATEVFVCPASQIRELVATDALATDRMAKGERGYVTILPAAPRPALKLPVTRPDEGRWQLRIEHAMGSFLLTRRRLDHPGKHYPNEVVEGLLNTKATTRGWDTFVKLDKLLAARRG